MISERPCDAKDWSNDAENSALHHRNKLHKKRKKENNCNTISEYYMFFFCFFDQINAALHPM